jgi:hypothetical protein
MANNAVEKKELETISNSFRNSKGGFFASDESFATKITKGPYVKSSKKSSKKSSMTGGFFTSDETMPTDAIEQFAKPGGMGKGKGMSKGKGMGNGMGMGKGMGMAKGGSMTKKQSSKSSKKTKKSKCSKPLPKGYACCMHCRKNVKILSSVIKKTKNGRNQMVGKAECGHTVYLFVKG